MKTKLFIPFLFLIAFASCSAGGQAETDSNGNALLNVMIIDSANVPSSEGSLTDNRWTRKIQEEMLEQNIKVNFESRGASVVKHTLMMATGSAPDLSITHKRLLFQKYAVDGGLTDLGPIIDEYGPNIKKVLGEEFLQYGVVNGTQYAIPTPTSTKYDKQQVSLIRKDWLDALGMDVPTNRDELEIVLKAFKERDPGGIGSDNVIPWGYIPPDPGTVFDTDFWLFDVMYSFMDHDPAKNMSSTWIQRDGFKEFLAWMNRLYQNGLIDREFATLSEDEMKRKVVNGQVGFIHWKYSRFYTQQSSSPLFILDQSDSPIEYIPIEIFQNDEGDYRKLEALPSAYYLFVPIKSGNAVAAISYINWLLEDETQKWMCYGLEGEHYELQGGVPTILDLEHYQSTFLYLQRYIQIAGKYPADPEQFHEYEKENRITDYDGMADLAAEMVLRDSFMAPLYLEEMPMMMKNGSGLVKITEKYWIKIITEKDFETNYNELVSKMEDRGLQEIQEERKSYYERNFK